MKYRILGKTGLKVSVIGFGGIPIQRVPEGEAYEVINKAVEQGINFFDTARAYTDSEAKLGCALQGKRDKVILATKSMARTKEGMTSDIKKSLEVLKVSQIDLYQLHNVKDKAALEQVLSPSGALAALKEAKKEGVVKHIGITGHTKNYLLEAIKTGELETVQFPFNAVELIGVPELLQLAGETNTGVIIMKPLAGGALVNTGPALRYILENPVVSTVIPGMDSVEQVQANTLIGKNILPLTAAERKTLDAESERLGTTFCRRCEYCLPCRQGIDIPTVFLLDGYYTRYSLKEWAVDRYRSLQSKVHDCIDCGECEERCAYNLPIRQMMAEAAERLS